MSDPTWSPTDHGSVTDVTATLATRNSTLGGNWALARSDLSQSAGVRYVEFTVIEIGSGFNLVGVGLASGAASSGNFPGVDNNGLQYQPAGNVVKNSVFTGAAPPSYVNGDVLGMLVDFTAETVKFRKNGGAFSATSDITSLGSDVFVAVGLGNGSPFASVQINASPTYPVGASAWTDTPLFPGATLNIVTNGDSISLTSTVQKNYLPRLAALLPWRVQWTRCGINGASWNYAWPSAGYPWTLTEDAPLRVDPARSATLTNWLIVFAGTNGMFSTLGAHSAATEYADFQTYITARLAAGWKAKEIIVCTMLPRTSMSESTRSTYNTSLVGGAATYGYRLARLDQNPSIGFAGQNLNTTWFQDGTHPTDAGHQIIAQVIATQISTLPPATTQTFQMIGLREDLR